MMNTIEADGKTYIKATDAARAVGYTADYVGQLCRKGSIDARFIGRSWYVREGELERQKKTKARANTDKTIKEMERELSVVEEEKQKIHKSVYVPGVTPEYRKRILETPVSYTTDEGELVPTLTQREHRQELNTVGHREEEDVVPSVPEEQTTEVSSFSVSEDQLESGPESSDEEIIEIKTSFPEEEEMHTAPLYREETTLPVKRQSFLPVVAASALGLLLVISSLFLEGSWVYTIKEDARTLSTSSSLESTFNLASVSSVIETLESLF